MSRIKVAWIPPIPHNREESGIEIRLILGHELRNSPEYVESLKPRSADTWVVLDNGAHEQRDAITEIELNALAGVIQADEVVAPDSLFSLEQTLFRSRKFIRSLSEEHPFRSVMVVPQGLNPKEWVECLKGLLDEVDRSSWRGGFSLGISKDYDSHPSFPGGLISLLTSPSLEGLLKVLPIHLLGWTRNLWTPSMVLSYFQETGIQIRSIDTAKPFVYALHNVDISTALYERGAIPEYPHRKPNYFSDTMTVPQIDIARANQYALLWTIWGNSDGPHRPYEFSHQWITGAQRFSGLAH